MRRGWRRWSFGVAVEWLGWSNFWGAPQTETQDISIRHLRHSPERKPPLEQTSCQTTSPQPEPRPENHCPLPTPELHHQDLADSFEVSQPTISRTIHFIEKVLLELEELKTPELESLKNVPGSFVIDGTLTPVKELVFTRENTVFR